MLALPALARDVQRAGRPQRLAVCVAGALAVVAGLEYPRPDATDLVIEAASWQGFVALRLATADPGEVLELLPLSLDEQAGAPRPDGAARDRRAARLARRHRADRGRVAREVPSSSRGSAARPRRPSSTRRSPPRCRCTPRCSPSPRSPRPTTPRTTIPRPSGARCGGSCGGSTAWASTAATTRSSRTSPAGFPGHERALALEAGEALLRAGVLTEKPSVGQRHVSLVAARTDEIRRLIAGDAVDDPEIDRVSSGLTCQGCWNMTMFCTPACSPWPPSARRLPRRAPRSPDARGAVREEGRRDLHEGEREARRRARSLRASTRRRATRAQIKLAGKVLTYDLPDRRRGDREDQRARLAEGARSRTRPGRACTPTCCRRPSRRSTSSQPPA